MNEWGGSVSLQAGDFGRLDAKGIINIPMIDDTLAGRIAVKSTNSDGYWKNPAVGKDRGATDRLTINPTLKWTPNERFSALLRGEWSETRDDTNMTQNHTYCRTDPANVLLGGPIDNDALPTLQVLHTWIADYGGATTPEAIGAAIAAGRSVCAKPLEDQSVDDEFTAINTEDRGQQYNTDVWGLTLQLDYALGEIGDLTYIGNYRDTEEDIIFTIDVAPMDLFAGRRVQDHYQTTHELRFASNFSDKFDFVSGAYYFEQEYAMKQSSWGMLFAPNLILNFPPDPTAITFTNPSSYGQAQFSTQLNKAWAVFTQANLHLGEKITITAGGRYTSETKKFKTCFTGDESQPASKAKNAEGCNNSPAFVIDLTQPPVLDPPGTTGVATPTPLWALTNAIGYDASGGVEGGCRPVLDPTGGPISCNNRLAPPKEKWTDFTPMAGITYRFNDDVMAYFTWTKGFTGGGWNGRGTTATSIGPFDPEKGENFELGIKSDWWDRRLRVNLTAFDTKVKDFQTAFIRAAPGGGGQETIQSNLGSFETEGVELEVSVVPTDYLNLWANVSHLKTKRVGFCTDPDGPHDFLNPPPGNPPTVGGPYSQDAAVCGPADPIFDSIGQFQGWLVPVDVSEIARSGRAPKWTMSAGFILNFNLDQMGSLTLSGDWQWSDDAGIGGSRVNEPDGVLQYNGDFIKHQRDSYNILNAAATWRSTSERYQVSAFVKNITNELYNQATTVVGGLLNFRNTNIRRHYAVEFKVNL